MIRKMCLRAQHCLMYNIYQPRFQRLNFDSILQWTGDPWQTDTRGTNGPSLPRTEGSAESLAWQDGWSPYSSPLLLLPKVVSQKWCLNTVQPEYKSYCKFKDLTVTWITRYTLCPWWYILFLLVCIFLGLEPQNVVLEEDSDRFKAPMSSSP